MPRQHDYKQTYTIDKYRKKNIKIQNAALKWFTIHASLHLLWICSQSASTYDFYNFASPQNNITNVKGTCTYQGSQCFHLNRCNWGWLRLPAHRVCPLGSNLLKKRFLLVGIQSLGRNSVCSPCSTLHKQMTDQIQSHRSTPNHGSVVSIFQEEWFWAASLLQYQNMQVSKTNMSQTLHPQQILVFGYQWLYMHFDCSMSFKVIDFCTNQNPINDFLLVINCDIINCDLAPFPRYSIVKCWLWLAIILALGQLPFWENDLLSKSSCKA